MATEETALTMKEAVMEVRKDVKDLLLAMATKADRSEFEALVTRVEMLERRTDVKDGIESYRKWMIGLGATVVLTLLTVVANIILRVVSGNR